MTERQFGFGWNSWYGKVVDVNDPDQEGKVKVRIYGLHDDETNIPDSDLPWFKPAQDITNAGQNKIGGIPVGMITGSIVGGHFLDTDLQHGVFTHTIAKAGDPVSNDIHKYSDKAPLVDGTNSTPIGGRSSNNAFVTRKGRNIVNDDKQKVPPEQNDKDGKDISADAKKSTQYGSHPTTGSIKTPTGSILTQIDSVDPNKSNSILPQAVGAYQKILDLNSFSSPTGVNSVLGQALGFAMQSNAGSILEALGQSALAGDGALSTIAQQALSSAIQSIGGNLLISQLSSTIQSVIGQSLGPLTSELSSLLNAGGLDINSFNSLMASHATNIQSNGSQATIGATPSNILSMASSLVPQISGAINYVLNNHLPNSVLGSGMQDAIRQFTLGQSFLKAPNDGKKALAELATSQVNQVNIASALTKIGGVSSDAIRGITKIL